MTTRAEHLTWCKERALAFLPDDPGGAFTSMILDLGKHDETCRHSGIRSGMQLRVTNNLPDMRKFIEGFN